MLEARGGGFSPRERTAAPRQPFNRVAKATAPVAWSPCMYLLYLDESGNENDPSNRYFVLAPLPLHGRALRRAPSRTRRFAEGTGPGRHRRRPMAEHGSPSRADRGCGRTVAVHFGRALSRQGQIT